MDNRALIKLTYGLFVLGSRDGNKINGCITDTCIQVASNPVRVAISVMNGNLTCSMVRKSGTFAITVLDDSCTYETIERFGMHSGRDMEKFSGLDFALDENENPYLKNLACAVLSCRVVSFQDLGTHSIFVAEVVDARVLNGKSPLTYAEYQKSIKPKKSYEERKIVGWKCKICGFVYEGSQLPADYVCPVCGYPAEDFEPIYED